MNGVEELGITQGHGQRGGGERFTRKRGSKEKGKSARFEGGLLPHEEEQNVVNYQT